MPERKTTKILTTEERPWLREWAYEFESPYGNGMTGVAHAIGYSSRQHLKRVLNDEAAKKGLAPGAWRRLMALLLETPDRADDFEIEAASAETRKQLRAARQRQARREAREAERERREARGERAVTVGAV